MTWQSRVWLALAIVDAVVFAVVEVAALAQKDRPGKPRTLTANIRWIIQPVAGWHMHARWLLIAFFAWIQPHLLGGS